VVLAVFFVSIVMAVGAVLIARRPQRSLTYMVMYGLGNVALLGVLQRMAGPFIFVPALSCVVVMSATAYPAYIKRPWILILTMVIGFLAPIILELQGILTRTWDIREGMLVSHAGALVLDGPPTLVMLIGASVVTIMIAGIHAARIYRANRDARLQLVTQAWHLRQLLPAH
jgi:hypothetical protein